MDLRPEDIIKAAITTPKSRHAFDTYGKLTFKVARDANKLEIRKAIEKIWDVKVDKVAVINKRGEARRFSGRAYVTPSVKKAVVTLKQGYKIEMPWQQGEAAPVQAEKMPEGS